MTQTKRRILLVLTIGFLIGGSAASYHHLWWKRPAGHGPAGPTVSKVHFQKVWRTNQVVLVGMGDSVTAGFGATKGNSYFDRLAKNPADEFQEMKGICLPAVFQNFTATNLSRSGSTSIQHMKVISSRLGSYSEDVIGIVVITTGGNDIIHNYGRTPPSEGAMYGATFQQAEPWIKNFEMRLEEMLAKIKRSFPGECHVFLANIYDPTDGIGDIEKAGLPAWKDGLAVLRAYNEVIQRCAEKHPFVYLVNMHDPFIGHGIHCTQFWRSFYHRADPHYWYHNNLEDPNDRGYDALRRLFLVEIAKVLAPK